MDMTEPPWAQTRSGLGCLRVCRQLLPVVPHCLGIAHSNTVGVQPELPAGAAPAHQIPALVERLLQLLQTEHPRLVERAVLMVGPQVLLLSHDAVHQIPYLYVVHRFSSAGGGVPL